VNCRYTTAAFTTSPESMGLRHVVLTCPDDGLVCCFCSSAHSFALRLPPDPSSRRRPCLRLVLVDFVSRQCLDSRTGDLHPISSRPCRAYTKRGRRSSLRFAAALSAVMREKMKNTDKDDYKVCFSGATISKREANKAGVALLFGLIGILTIGLVFGIQNKMMTFIISLILVFIGYFGIANRLFKKDR